MLAELKEQEIELHVYVEQAIMWKRELTPLLERIRITGRAGAERKAI